ncbi:MAG: tRNA preQ1(34) S-adenosylmethionine ribosyltransferase-isomerase QueA [Kiritimatiellae bacterium]|nr:tRNA preQ1(34) S-adenosylmethionine ribosyltransferase-isomerase QueA [Kiritimatiellia bacterium]
MKTSDFDYALPPELIAQVPPKERGTSRMMVLHRDTGAVEHRHVGDIVDYLDPKDLMVFNDTRVFAARAFGRWEDTPGRVEVLFVEPSGLRPGAWTALCRSSRPMKPGRAMLLADGEIRATVLEKSARDGHVDLALDYDGDFFGILDRTGVPPVPPYIRRGPGDPRVGLDRERYQTVYARETGAVAAPTAGLHFSEELLAKIDAKGVARAFVTLHVGPGTFRPVKAETVEEHVMDSERYEIPERTAAAVAACRARGGRVFGVGSTSVRTLETSARAHGGAVVAEKARSSIFIHPPYEFLAVDAMLTNFHLPQSTLLMMVSALAGRERVLAAYEEAIRERYRFYSYGDCMLIM